MTTPSSNVYRQTEIVGSSPEGLEAAIRAGIQRARKTIRHLDWFEVTEIRGHFVEGARIGHYQVTMKLGFRVEDGD